MKRLYWQSMIMFVCGLVAGAAFAEGKTPVFVHHAPNSFVQTLNAVDESSRIVVSTDVWFPPNEATFWAIFIDSNEPLLTLPRVVELVAERTESSPNPLVRVKAELGNGSHLQIQINDLSKTEKGADFQGCIAALDLASFVFNDSRIANPASVREYCSRFVSEEN